jgi:GntR family transcriptional regulator, transcriptional repressor for pyruvate dehydrogenase complex
LTKQGKNNGMPTPDTASVAIAADPTPLDGFSRLTQRTVTADVVDQIKRLITLGTLVPGQRLPSERVLADLLGVSRPTTREAVRALEAMGIVSTRHGSGTFVTDLSAETLARPLIFVLDINRNALHELFAVRVLLEAGAAEAAAASADIHTCDRLAACIAEMRGAADAESFLGPDLAFHQIVHQASENALISALMNGLRALTRASLLASAAGEPARREAADEHEAILAALRQRDGAAAAQAMRQHVGNARRRSQATDNP